MMVQYRGKLMPLVPLDPAMTLRDEGRIPVLVFTDDERSMGLVVDQIVDIVEEKLDVELNSERPGFVGSAVLAGKATEIVDVAHYLDHAFADWFRRHEEAPFGGAVSRRILLVDDSAFFRNLLKPLLETAGYEVTTAQDPQAALKMREDGAEFDVIVSDIEMPGMNGFDFAREVKADGRWKETPIVALTSHATPRDIERGRNVGFCNHVAKLDRDALLRTLSETCSQMGEAA
jgi:two-component system chemotaxis sensor kinase CheA